jgi:L-aspartate semialdehyde sulfurtransferase ferredoxin
MAAVTVEINAGREFDNQPLVWRLGKLFRVVTNIRRARVSDDMAYLSVEMEGSQLEVEQATNYLRRLGVLRDDVEPWGEARTPSPPEKDIEPANTIYVGLKTVNAAQADAPILYRIGRDFDVYVNIERAMFDEEEGGFVDISITGNLTSVQRAIAYLHTTGLHVNPRQRSVTDYSNL